VLIVLRSLIVAAALILIGFVAMQVTGAGAAPENG
jgi:hypothetical protein